VVLEPQTKVMQVEHLSMMAAAVVVEQVPLAVLQPTTAVLTVVLGWPPVFLGAAFPTPVVVVVQVDPVLVELMEQEGLVAVAMLGQPRRQVPQTRAVAAVENPMEITIQAMETERTAALVSSF
jgi:hypothetical protein